MSNFEELSIAELDNEEDEALYPRCTNCDSGLRQRGADIARFSLKRML